MAKKPSAVAALMTACKGLLYPSETDAAIEVVPIEEARISELLFIDQGEEPSEFRRLYDLVCRELDDIHAYRIGAVEVEILIIGRVRNTGKLIALRTKAVVT